MNDDIDLPSDGSCRPCIVVDSREQTPLAFRRLASVVGTLGTGDYSARGLEHHLVVERKSVADLIGSLGPERERFERELHRLRGFVFPRLLIVGTEAEVIAGRYRSNMKPRSVMASLHAFEARYGVPIVWVADPESAARLVERWAAWCAYDVTRSARLLAKGMPEAVEAR
ncbi:MAG: ERCC4 domain-containing protein [Verrucomicrobiae bacterium]|nr:ERCC4 domain-containing protein [Verrucomicrobiae bacterium]